MIPESHASGDDIDGPSGSGHTAVDPASPFDSTEQVLGPEARGTSAPRATQLTSDPPTAVVRRDSFRELPPGTVVGDTYEIDARLGAGAMGEVYAAHHVKLGKRVAIKVIGQRLSEDNAAIERFAMEAKTLAKIQHPAIVAVDHVGELADGRAFFSMELLLGESLFDRFQRGRIPLHEALRILDQMARGLEAAHAHGVVHRDLKPENTFLVHLPGEPPAVKLVDFGLSKLRGDRSDLDHRAERTQSGVAIGTPMYMSPEQARGPDVDHRTDIYALGVVAYELLLGQPPFPHARTAPELFAAHLHEAPPLPRSIWTEIPPPLDLVLFAMLAKDPTHRPTLAQVRAVIAASRGAGQPAATEFVRPRAPGRWWRRAAVAGGVLTVLAAGITIGVRVGPAPDTAETEAKADAPTLLREERAEPHERPERSAGATAPATAPARPETVPPVPKRSSAPQKSRSNRASRLPARATNPPVVPPGLPTAIPADAGAESPPPKPLDRNQTIDPFKKANP